MPGHSEMASRSNKRSVQKMCCHHSTIFDTVTDVNEIQHFVNVALATAAGGEDDLSHDKLSYLRTVGSGFASLIYNFPKDAGFIELKEACTYVWEALTKNENLPNLLVSTCIDQSWDYTVMFICAQQLCYKIDNVYLPQNRVITTTIVALI